MKCESCGLDEDNVAYYGDHEAELCRDCYKIMQKQARYNNIKEHEYGYIESSK